MHSLLQHLQGLIKNNGPTQLIPSKPVVEVPASNIKDVKLASPPAYKVGEAVATRLAYGTALAKLAQANNRVIALDGDTKNSTYSDKVLKVNSKPI